MNAAVGHDDATGDGSWSAQCFRRLLSAAGRCGFASRVACAGIAVSAATGCQSKPVVVPGAAVPRLMSQAAAADKAGQSGRALKLYQELAALDPSNSRVQSRVASLSRAMDPIAARSDVQIAEATPIDAFDPSALADAESEAAAAFGLAAATRPTNAQPSEPRSNPFAEAIAMSLSADTQSAVTQTPASSVSTATAGRLGGLADSRTTNDAAHGFEQASDEVVTPRVVAIDAVKEASDAPAFAVVEADKPAASPDTANPFAAFMNDEDDVSRAASSNPGSEIAAFASQVATAEPKRKPTASDDRGLATSSPVARAEDRTPPQPLEIAASPLVRIDSRKLRKSLVSDDATSDGAAVSVASLPTSTRVRSVDALWARWQAGGSSAAIATELAATLRNSVAADDSAGEAAALAALGQMQSDAVESRSTVRQVLIEAASNDPMSLRAIRAAETLLKIDSNDPVANRALQVVVKSGSGRQRVAAAAALGRGNRTAVPFLRATLRDPSEPVRAAAALALAKHGPEASHAIDDLREVTTFDTPVVRQAAHIALDRIER